MKTEDKFQKFLVSQVGVLIRNNKCLILEFSSHPGKWGLPGGRVDKRELKEEAFRREIKEELGIDSFEIISPVDYDIHYTEEGTAMCGIANFIKNDKDKIVLSHEHTKLAWVKKEDLKNYNFVWPYAQRMLEKGFDFLEKNK